MKNKVLALGLMSVFLGLTSCSDDTPISGTPLEQGAEINFGSALDPTSDIISRTYYGDPTTEGNKTFWPIYWNASPDNDHIFIYSPQANGSRNQAKYTVNRNDAHPDQAAKITKDGSFGVQAGATSTNYKFYAMYPASAVQGTATGTSISATLSPDQEVTFAGTKNNPSTKLPPENAAGEIAYLTKPDMSNSLMTANESVATLTDEPVVLHFKPFTSVIDITITGPKDNNTITGNGMAAITSVEVVADANIAGDFTYNFDDGSFNFGQNGTNSITVYTYGNDAAGNRSGITLANQNTLNLQAFILPNPAVKTLKVVVHTSDSQTWTKSLTMTNFAASKIHPVALPALTFAEATFDYSVWLSQLDPRIYISEISLPGSISSSSFRNTGNDMIQELGLTDQFNAGVRVFQSHAWLYPETSSLDNKPTHIGLNVNGSAEVVSLYQALTNLQKEMNEAHGNEFCVFILSDYQYNGTYTQDEFMKRFKVVVNEMVNKGIVAGNITPNTTLADVKGKIILKYQLNGSGNSSDGSTSNTSNTNTLLKKIQSWSALDGADMLFNWWTSAAGNTVFYAPLVFRQIGKFDITQEFEVTWNSQFHKATIGNTQPGLATDAANKLLDNSGHSNTALGSGWYSNINPTTPPTSDPDFNTTNKMWYMYAEQANAGGTQQHPEYYTDAKNNITNMVNCFTPTYNGTSHNKFYMVFCGGAGSSSHSTADIATEFAGIWSDAVGTNWGNKPFGWVMFNRVLLPTKENQDNAVVQAIQKVISQNNDTHYKLKRDYNKDVTPKQSPTGNTQGTTPGGVLFGK